MTHPGAIKSTGAGQFVIVEAVHNEAGEGTINSPALGGISFVCASFNRWYMVSPAQMEKCSSVWLFVFQKIGLKLLSLVEGHRWRA